MYLVTNHAVKEKRYLPQGAMKLTEKEVGRVYKACLAGNGGGIRRVAGLQNAIHWFNPVSLREHHARITAMLEELSAEFHKLGGGNLSHVVQHCNGTDWTDQFPVAERLMLLGVATGQVEVIQSSTSGHWPNYQVLEENSAATSSGAFQEAE